MDHVHAKILRVVVHPTHGSALPHARKNTALGSRLTLLGSAAKYGSDAAFVCVGIRIGKRETSCTSWRRAEGRGQRAEGRGQRAEGRGQRAEGSVASSPMLAPSEHVWDRTRANTRCCHTLQGHAKDTLGVARPGAARPVRTKQGF